MSVLVTLFDVVVAAYRLAVASWNACIVFLQILRSVLQDAKQEAAEAMALLDDDTPMMDAITSASSLFGASAPVSTWQMLIIARASTFILLVRLSKHRILHLEVDESFIAAKLEVIQTELILHIQHVPRLLQMPIGTHDTRLVRYKPMKLPYVWKEERASPLDGSKGIESSIVPAASLATARTGLEGPSRRKKCVQLLTESALRRRLHMDRLGRADLDVVPKRGTIIIKTQRESAKRKALANATNKGFGHAEGGTDADKALDEMRGSETPKQARMERNLHAALSENLSIPNMGRPASLRKAAENVQQPQSTGGPQSLRRRRGHFGSGLYAQGVSSEFSLVPKLGQGSD